MLATRNLTRASVDRLDRRSVTPHVSYCRSRASSGSRHCPTSSAATPSRAMVAWVNRDLHIALHAVGGAIGLLTLLLAVSFTQRSEHTGPPYPVLLPHATIDGGARTWTCRSVCLRASAIPCWKARDVAPPCLARRRGAHTLTHASGHPVCVVSKKYHDHSTRVDHDICAPSSSSSSASSPSSPSGKLRAAMTRTYSSIFSAKCSGSGSSVISRLGAR